MENKKIKITTPQQFDRLVELMEENPHLPTGFTKSVHKYNIKDEWNKIADKINYLGPPVRPGEGWKKVWEDYKFKLKKKLVHNKTECSATGGGPFKQFILSATDEAAVSLLRLHSLISPGPSIGVSKSTFNENEEDDTYILENCEIVEEGTVLFSPKNKKEGSKIGNKNGEARIENVIPSTSKHSKEKQKTKYDLLSEQLKVQSDLYTEVKQTLKEIERYSRKSFKLKEEKLQLYKNELKKKEEFRKSLYKLKEKEIEIKRRKIELEELKNGF